VISRAANFQSLLTEHFHPSVNYLTLQRAAWVHDSSTGIMRTLETSWLNKGLAVVAAALLIGLALTQFAGYARFGSHTGAKHDDVKAHAMARGGQFEKAPLW
jgi:hypothetical protein